MQLFSTKETKPKDLLVFGADTILAGVLTHIGAPSRTLSRYIRKIGKLIENGTPTAVRKSSYF
ncbi:MAG: hypothetical protein ACFFD2_06105 [Promethearchaeota archaeon]